MARCEPRRHPVVVAMEVERKGEPCLQGALVSNARKFTNLAPVSYITAILVGWG